MPVPFIYSLSNKLITDKSCVIKLTLFVICFSVPKFLSSDGIHTAISDPTQTRITFNRNVFEDPTGLIKWYEIIVAHKGKQTSNTSGIYADTSEIPIINRWKDTKNGEEYRATPTRWYPFESKYSYHFTLLDMSI